MMKRFPFLLFSVLLVLSSSRSSGADATDQRERVIAAYVLSFGRVPSGGELEQESKLAPASIPELLNRLSQRLQSDAVLQRSVAAKASRDAFGVELPSKDADGSGSYAAIVDQHVRRLAADSSMYEQMLRRVYPLVVHREIYPEEIAYWSGKPTLPFYLLVACVDNWARRNQPGLMLTVGTPTIAGDSVYLTTARVSPALATEFRGNGGPASENDPVASLAIAAGHNLLGAVGSSVVTAGHVYFAAAGAEDLVTK